MNEGEIARICEQAQAAYGTQRRPCSATDALNLLAALSEATARADEADELARHQAVEIDDFGHDLVAAEGRVRTLTEALEAAGERAEAAEIAQGETELDRDRCVTLIERIAAGDYSGYSGAVQRAQAFLTARTAVLAGVASAERSNP